MNRIISSLITILLFFQLANAQENNPSVFDPHSGRFTSWLSYNNHQNALYNIITTEAFELLDKRAEKVARL